MDLPEYFFLCEWDYKADRDRAVRSSSSQTDPGPKSSCLPQIQVFRSLALGLWLNRFFGDEIKAC
ncbi:MAG: hypothetical protein DWI02_02275 [Planctomycetota bacterium]|nr:MAG: hypothetical protein DWI02_02275 [Planctomycetota bacterium]